MRANCFNCYGAVVFVITKKIFVEIESKRKGTVWGIFGGLVALYLSILFILYTGWMLNFDGEGQVEEWMNDLYLFFRHDNAFDVFTSSLSTFIFSLIFGGFLAPILGGIMGRTLSKTNINPSIDGTFD